MSDMTANEIAQMSSVVDNSSFEAMAALLVKYIPEFNPTYDDALASIWTMKVRIIQEMVESYPDLDHYVISAGGVYMSATRTASGKYYVYARPCYTLSIPHPAAETN